LRSWSRWPFAVAASANLPDDPLFAFLETIQYAGAVAGLGTGLLASIVLILLSPSMMTIDPPTVPAQPAI